MSRTKAVILILVGIGFGLLALVFRRIRLSRLHLMGRLYLPSPVWYLSLRQ
jgi:hypothetical protein